MVSSKVSKYSTITLHFAAYVVIGYYTSNPPFNQAPRLAVGAVGPITIALQYIEVSTCHHVYATQWLMFPVPLLGLIPFFLLREIPRFNSNIHVGRVGPQCLVAGCVQFRQ